MKTKFTLFIAAFALAFSVNAQQIPNGGFETWTDSLAPDGWCTIASIFPAAAPFGLSARDTAIKAAGTSSVRLTNQYIALATDTVPGILSLGTGAFTGQPQFFGMPWNVRVDTFFFSYRYAPVGNDTAGMEIGVQRQAGGYSLQGAIPLNGTNGQWQNVFVPVLPFYSDTVSAIDTLELLFYSSYLQANKPRIGSTFHVDRVSVATKNVATGIEAIDNTFVVSTFPNPANDNVTITLREMPKSTAIIAVVDVTGRVMTQQFVLGTVNNIPVLDYPVGIYSYTIVTDGKIVSKGRFNVAH